MVVQFLLILKTDCTDVSFTCLFWKGLNLYTTHSVLFPSQRYVLVFHRCCVFIAGICCKDTAGMTNADRLTVRKKKKARALLEGEQTCVSHLEKSARMSSTFKNKLFYPIEAHGCLLFLRQKKQKKRPDRNHWSTTLLWATQNKKISCIKFALKKNLFSNVNCSSLKDPVSINSWKQHYDASLYPTQLPTK